MLSARKGKYKGKERNTWIPIVEEARNYEKIEKIHGLIRSLWRV